MFEQRGADSESGCGRADLAEIPVRFLGSTGCEGLLDGDPARGERLGAVLRRARGSRTILELAREADVSPETLRKIESGRVATPAFSTIAAVAAVLDLSLDAVWAEITSPVAFAVPLSRTPVVTQSRPATAHRTTAWATATRPIRPPPSSCTRFDYPKR